MVESNSPRVPFLASKEEVPEENHHSYDAIVESRDRVIGPFGVLLNSPEVAERTAHLGTYLRFESELPGAVRELAILTTARECDCPFEWAVHEPLAREAGVSETAIEAVKRRVDLEKVDGSEQLVVAFGREVFRENGVSEATFDDASARFGDAGVTELAATFGYYSMLAVVLNALEVAPKGDYPTFA